MRRADDQGLKSLRDEDLGDPPGKPPSSAEVLDESKEKRGETSARER